MISETAKVKYSDPTKGLARLYAIVKGETAPPTSAMHIEGQDEPSANVGVILKELGRKWKEVFSNTGMPLHAGATFPCTRCPPPHCPPSLLLAHTR